MRRAESKGEKVEASGRLRRTEFWAKQNLSNWSGEAEAEDNGERRKRSHWKTAEKKSKFKFVPCFCMASSNLSKCTNGGK